MDDLRVVRAVLAALGESCSEEELRPSNPKVIRARAVIKAVRRADGADRPSLAEVASRGSLGMNAIVYPRRRKK